MKSVLLVHGAANGPWVFEGWAEALPDADVFPVDLHAGLSIAEASMSNYEAAVTAASSLLQRPLAICGWSMGGLAAMMAARRVGPDALVLIEPSPPAEVQGFDETVAIEPGTFGAEVYGPFPEGMPARPESLLARTERKRGVPVPSLPAHTVVISGADFADARGAGIARRYGIEEVAFPEASHWDLVRDPSVREQIAARLVSRSR